MAERCPKCVSVYRIKAGLNSEKIQRFKCKVCGCHYTRSDKKGYPTILKRQAIQLYLAGLGFRAIGRVLNVSNVTVLNWICGIKEHLSEFKPTEAHKVEVIGVNEVFKRLRNKNGLVGVSLIMRLIKQPFDQASWAWVEIQQTKNRQ